MENFDIEKLERKNIYKTPEGFFSAAQEQVLQRTLAPAGHIIPLPAQNVLERKNKNSWRYVTAAAIAAVFGAGFFYSTLNEEKEPEVQQAVAVDIEPAQKTEVPIQAALAEAQVTANEKQEVSDLTTSAVTHPTNERHQRLGIAKKEPVKHQPVYNAGYTTEKKADEVISELPKEDVLMLAAEAEPDVYLELYN